MPLVSNNRAQALLTVIQANNPLCAQLTPSELASFTTSLQAIVMADTSYLVTNTTVVPDSFAAKAAISVQVNALSGTGATTAPGPLTGTGKIS